LSAANEMNWARDEDNDVGIKEKQFNPTTIRPAVLKCK